MTDLRINIPEDFLKEEIRCDYLVTESMKRVWAVELDLAGVLLEICKKNNLKVYAFAGTELGAIRHKGFIPWDDDIDFTMPRDDYEKLCEIAPSALSHPYFFQTEYNDRGSLRGHAQLRNSMTTGIVRMNFDKGYKFNQGIFVDIFPVDNIPDDNLRFIVQLQKIKKAQSSVHTLSKFNTRYTLKYDKNPLKKILKMIGHYPVTVLDNVFKIEERLYRRYEKCCAMANGEVTKLCGTLSFLPEEERFYWCNDDTVEIEWVPFEFLQFPVAKGYDNKLKRAYGDYHVFIKNSAVHSGVFFDTERPYTFYLEKGILQR